MGIPLTVAFQLLVRRRPLRELWVRRGGARSGLSRREVALTALLGLAPVYWGVQAVGDGNLSVIGWYVVFHARWFWPTLRDAGVVVILGPVAGVTS